MLKETETEETIVFFVTFLSLVAFQLGGGWAPRAPPDYAYDAVVLSVDKTNHYKEQLFRKIFKIKRN